jgi:geranylgeranyl diphosphate synthase, type I
MTGALRTGMPSRVSALGGRVGQSPWPAGIVCENVATDLVPPDPARLGYIRAEVSAAIAAFLARQREVLAAIGADVLPCLDAIQSLLAGGKRLRPAFCYWGWQAAGGRDCPEIFATAAALELLQASALVHDDVMDDSNLRRGQPAVHRRFASWHAATARSGAAGRFGVGAAILVGDLLLAWTNEMFAGSGFAPPVLRAGASVLSAMQTELAAGQYLDLLSQANASTSIPAALRVITYKTAKYSTERPLQLGVALAVAAASHDEPDQPGSIDSAGRADELAGVCARYGSPLGIAFQLRDDLLGVFGDPARTGKPVCGDIAEGKRTVLLALARDRASAAQAAVLDRHLGDRGLTDAGATEVRAVLADTGAVAECEHLIAAYRKEAVTALDGAPISGAARSALTALAEYLTSRDE